MDEPAEIDFCDILNANGVTCPAEESNLHYICITIWRDEFPSGISSVDYYDRLCANLLIFPSESSGISSMYYLDDPDDAWKESRW